MYTMPDGLTAANKANVEAFLTLANTAFASAERLAALHLNTARAFLGEGMSGTQAIVSAKDVQALIGMQNSLAQPLIERMVTYSRGVYEITKQTQDEISKIVESQVAEVNKNVVSALDKVAKNAPAGSDVAVAAVKSAMAAANSAYDNMSKAAKQVAEITEANVTAATSTTVRAASDATSSPKGKKNT